MPLEINSMAKIKDKQAEFETKFGNKWDEVLSDELAKEQVENGTGLENANEIDERVAGEAVGEIKTTNANLPC